MNRQKLEEKVEAVCLVVSIILAACVALLLVDTSTAKADSWLLYETDEGGFKQDLNPSQRLRVEDDSIEVYELDAGGFQKDLNPSYRLELEREDTYDRDLTGADTISPPTSFLQNELRRDL